jgi:hypothetical protein
VKLVFFRKIEIQRYLSLHFQSASPCPDQVVLFLQLIQVVADGHLAYPKHDAQFMHIDFPVLSKHFHDFFPAVYRGLFEAVFHQVVFFGFAIISKNNTKIVL